MYNVKDLLDKAIQITKKRKELYEHIEIKNDSNNRAEVLKNVFIKNIQKTIEYYEKLKLEVNESEAEVIDFVVYDKISFLITQFKNSGITIDITDTRKLLYFSLNYDKKVYALYIDIQGRLLKKQEDEKSSTYQILSRIIRYKEKQINDLEILIENYLGTETIGV